jgi:serine protease Do
MPRWRAMRPWLSLFQQNEAERKRPCRKQKSMQGEVVGVNTAIFTRSSGNIGIGFAIPINLVRDLLPELKTKGKVIRGWLGVTIQKVTPALAESFGLDRPRGALVASVVTDSPADRGGMKAGDVITEFDGKKIEDSNDLPLIVARTPVSKRVQVKVIRDKEQMSLPVAVGELKAEEVIASAEERKNFGLTVQNVTPEIAESLGMDRAEGVVVRSVRPGSAADKAGFRRGDVILEIDRESIKNLSDFQKAVSNIAKEQVVLVLVDRGEMTRFLALRAPG